MKTFFVVCLALAAVAEPDAQVLLNSPFYSGLALQQPLTYAVVPQTQYVKKVDDVVEVVAEPEKVEKVEAPKVAVYTAPKQVLSYGAVPYAALPYTTAQVIQPQVVPKYVAKNGEVEHIVVKREAEADPQLIYSAATPYAYNPYVYSAAVAQPVVYNAQPVVYKTAATAVVDPLVGVKAKTYANDFNPFTQTYAAKGQYVADSVGARHVAKREADPQLVYSAGSYSPYTYAAAAYAYNPVVYNTLPLQAKTYANDFHPFSGNYAAKGQYVANSGGAIHVAKREAEAAEMAMNKPFAPWTQLNAGNPVRSFELNHQTLYKREAEAEPQYLYGNNPLWNVSPYRAYTYGYGYPYASAYYY